MDAWMDQYNIDSKLDYSPAHFDSICCKHKVSVRGSLSKLRHKLEKLNSKNVSRGKVSIVLESLWLWPCGVCRKNTNTNMRLWRKAAGALKDRNSIWIASLFSRTTYRNAYLDPLIIKATSHDENHLDYENVERVFRWINTSPVYLKSFLWGLSTRLEKTRCWVVAIKGLILIHGVFCLNIPVFHRIGRLPFDLSNFNDGHAKPDKAWGYNLFVRSYYAYLDRRSATMASEVNKQRKEDEEESVMDELEKLQRLQGLLDTLLQIKPHPENVKTRNIIVEAMNAIRLDMLNIYFDIHDGIERVVLRICNDGGKFKASLALKVIEKSANQEDDLTLYLEFCRDIGVLNTSKFPIMERVSDKMIQALNKISNGVSQKKSLNDCQDQAIVVRENKEIAEVKACHSKLITLITYKWEDFEDDISKGTSNPGNPFEEPIREITQWPTYNVDLPDLISL